MENGSKSSLLELTDQRSAPTADTAWLQAFAEEVFVSFEQYQPDVLSPPLAGILRHPWNALKSAVKEWVHGRGYHDVAKYREVYRFVQRYGLSLNRAALLFSDHESRALLAKLMAYRVLGDGYVKLPLDTPDVDDQIRKMDALADPKDMLDAEFMGWSLARCDLSSCAIPVRLYTLPSAAWTQFILEQYRCINGAVTIEASPGDIVIDAGGCWGDTALYFANKIGAEGRVFTFEFMDRHLAIMEKNFSLNHHLRDRISVIHHALWDRSGQPLTYSDNGPATAVSERKAGPNTTYTISVDDFVESAGLPRIDFIKMDIEGAELGALKGAEQTIRRWRPKLAICVYHKLEDFFEIPEYLASLDVGYELFLRHYSATAGETVLFASPQAGSSSL